ncbi:MAG: amino acid ABC transporter permease [Desulfobacterales bacterium]
MIWFVMSGAEKLGYNWQWYRVPGYILSFDTGQFVRGPLLEGLQVTLQITVLSLGLASVFGLATAFLRLAPSFFGRIMARLYLELIRNTPLLVQLFFIYFVLGPILDISRFASAVLALSLFEGAYASEIFRAGIVSIEQGQWEAARSLGMNTASTYRHIILPQAIPRILPPLTGQTVSLIKDSALVSTIAIYDLTMQAQAIISETWLTFELWFTVAGIYLMLTIPLSLCANLMEKYLRVKS